MWIALFSQIEESHKGIPDQVTRFEIGIVALKKTFIFLKEHPICISIFLSHVLITPVHYCKLEHLETVVT